MVKKDLVQKISLATNIDVNVVEIIVKQYNEQIMKSLEEGDAVWMRGFGSFQPVARKAKKGQNISRGTTIEIPAKIKPVFKPSEAFINLLNKKA